ncbi:GNAT family N-acetyltransferase [Aquipuribacter sp. SD81]|uniref:GNAT family N-acetyltransferase n=1 Tax=Aquipuribacter sp. SD81 TaxID=3127703 RepID=UPI00301AB4C3
MTAAPAERVAVRVRAVGSEETALVARCGRLVAAVYGDERLVADEEGYLRVVADAAPRAAEAVLLAALAGPELLASATYATAGNRWAELARPGEAEMRMLAVAPAARGRGVGRLVTQHCLDRARDEGLTRFVLSSGPRMTGAHRMYEGMGFRRTPERDWSPGPGIDLVTYAYEL